MPPPYGKRDPAAVVEPLEIVDPYGRDPDAPEYTAPIALALAEIALGHRRLPERYCSVRESLGTQKRPEG